MSITVSGALPLLGAADLLQILSFNHRSVQLLTASHAGKCELVIVDGRVRHAMVSTAAGMSELPVHLTQARAFALKPEAETPSLTYTLDLPMEKLLFQLAMQPPITNDARQLSEAFVEGAVGALSLLELFQIYENNGLAAEVLLTPERGQSVRFLLSGGLLCAGGSYAMPEHVYAALGVRAASFRITPTTLSPSEEFRKFNISSVVMEGLRRIDESRRGQDDKPDPHAEEMLQALADGKLSEAERVEMARQYLPGGVMTPTAVIARLAVDESPAVRDEAVRTLLSYPAEVKEAMACDAETPVPVLRFLLKESGSKAVETAVLANAAFPSACLLDFLPLCTSAHMDALRQRENALRDDAALRKALLAHPGCPYREWLEQIDAECAPRLRRHIFGDSDPTLAAAHTLVLERPPMDEEDGERVSSRLGPKDLQYIAKRGTLRQKMSIVCGNEAELACIVVSQPGIPEPFLLAVAESTTAHSAALSWVGGNARCRRSAQIVRALLLNPKTPVPTSASLLPMVRVDLIQKLADSRDIPDGLRQQARRLLEKKGKS